MKNNHILYSSDMPVNCFKSNKVALWFCCMSASTRYAEHNSIAQESINQGAEAALGFRLEVESSKCTDFAEEITRCLTEGYTLNEAVQSGTEVILRNPMYADDIGDATNPINCYRIFGNANVSLKINN